MISKNDAFNRRARRVRYKLRKNGGLRLSVFRSERHFYAQLIDDMKSLTLCSASTIKQNGLKGMKAKAAFVGKVIAEIAIQKGLKEVVLDRSGYAYHGSVVSFAEAARAAGLVF